MLDSCLLTMIATNNAYKIQEIRDILQTNVISPKDIGVYEFNPIETGDTFEENAMIKANTLLKAVNNLYHDKKPYFESKSKILIIADDSGICVDLLDGMPGVYSARYATLFKNNLLPLNEHNKRLLNKMLVSVSPSDEENREALKHALEQTGFLISTAAFRCCIAYIVVQIDSNRGFQEILKGEVNGICSGVVAIKECGKNGFGYDSMFYSKYDFGAFGNVELLDLDSKTEFRAFAIPKNIYGDIALQSLQESFATISLEEKNQISHRNNALLELKKKLCNILD
ncbi:non-canonical purine NTP pyrophosphatase [Helicobacter muridarum]|uniref:HAM1-like protein n=1 Tax=Helicobacter muridarum TaxID=216 RepID=A0A099TYZ3_9HELI|nr:non-canonical purine NTP pyrophosphatase [Helicobacter muridarum]TLE00019.1 non-canonical purine NTP pyrophosphatase [Helicobacter muridarum]STQ87094.1 HAM1-like protein [Helicobacter muridarum]